MDEYKKMLEEVRDRVANGESFEEIRDSATEYADSWVPVYNSDIIKEWCEMDSEFTDIGATEYGATGTIVQLMMADLFYCYAHYYELAINEVEEEIESNKACNHSGDFLGVVCSICGLLVGNCCGTVDNNDNPVCGVCAEK